MVRFLVLDARKSGNLWESKMLNTHIKSVFIDHEHAHVLGQQFAGMPYRKTGGEIIPFIKQML